MIEKKKKNKNFIKKGIAVVLALVMFVGATDVSGLVGLPGIPQKVEASVYEDVIKGMVENNITNRLKFNYNTVYTSNGSINGNRTISETSLNAFQAYESKCFPTSLSFSENDILTAINNNKSDSTGYSSVSVAGVMKSLLDNYVFYLMDAESADAEVSEKSNPNYSNFISANTFYGSTGSSGESYQKKLTKANPWDSKVIGYDNSPLSPGLDYSGQSMSSGYTIGQLIVDYLHANYTASGLVSDSRIMELYDSLATQAESPFIDMAELQKLILADINAGNIVSNADRSYTQMISTNDMVTYQDYVLSLPEDSPIPTGTLFIGTWLIDAQSITEPFYRMAVQSMTTYNQQVMLYKSELSSGYWKNIYGASGLEDILPIAENVSEYEETTVESPSIAGITAATSEDGVTTNGMAGYFIDIVVGKDGIPRKAKDGSEVDVFSLVNPYEMDTLPELRALKAMLDAGMVTPYDSTDSSKYIYYELSRFFENDQPYNYTVTDIYDKNYKKTVTLTKEDFQEACDYILSCARKTDIAFYAQNPQRDVRMEQSGNGFLNSLELTADTPSYADGWLHYNYQGHGGYSGRKFYISRLMVGNDDGTFGWKGENDWIAEIKSLPKGLDTFNRYSQIFRRVWRHKSQVHDEVTDQVDSRMGNIKNLYKELCMTGEAEDKELAYEAINVQNSLDALRRYEVYYNMIENKKANIYIGPTLMFLYECISEGTTSIGCDFNMRWNTDEAYQQKKEITAAVEEAIVDCTESMYTYEQQALLPGTTIASQLEYDLSNTVIDGASQGAANVRPALRQLEDLDNITNNVIAHKARELSMVTNNLLPTADSKFASAVHQGVGEDYQRAASYSTTTQSALDEILKDQKAGVSSVASELQTYIKARAMRLPTADAITFINERIDRAESLRAGITIDAFSKYAGEALDEHIAWLQDLLATVKEGGDLTDDGTDYDVNIGDYENDLADALNNGDLDGAEAAERKLAEAAQKANEDETASHDVLNDPNASASDKANASDVDTPTGVGDKIFNDAKIQIGENDWDKLEDDIDALIGIGSPKLQDLLPDLEANNAPDSLINKVNEALENLDDNDFNDHYGNTDTSDPNINTGAGDMNNGGVPVGPGNGSNTNPNGDGTGGDNSGTTTGLNSGDIDLAIEEAFGSGVDDLADDDAAAALAALVTYEDVLGGEDDDLDSYIQELLQQLIDARSVFIYRQYLENTEKEFVSLAAVSRCRKYTRFRLVTKDEISTMSQIAGGSASYGFEVGKKGVTKNNSSKEKMDDATVSQEDEYLYGSKIAKYPYISEESSGKYLYCSCAYVKDSEWAVLITPSTDKKVAQLLDLLDLYADTDF